MSWALGIPSLRDATRTASLQDALAFAQGKWALGIGHWALGIGEAVRS
ncbi:MAG: hypothetical protein RM049_36710 [Nostoc sp. DedQUE04]|nr:hypothetical protein [Nostoc sp. DedQUE04]MDZ8140775.1 hypothetical protein [Nostoc sp. DedQUE04]